MAGIVKILDTAALITADRSIAIPGGKGAFSSVSFFVDVTAITRTTGSFTVQLRKLLKSGALLSIALTGAITAAGITEIVKQAGFDAAPDAIPEPTWITWNLTGDATLVSGAVYAIYGG